VKFDTPAWRTIPSSTSGRTDCITRRADTNGFFQWTYSRSMASVRRRSRDPLTCHATIGSSGAIGVNLVATISCERSSAGRDTSVSPMIRSERAGPYPSAVSSIVIPSSAARRISAGAVILAYGSP